MLIALVLLVASFMKRGGEIESIVKSVADTNSPTKLLSHFLGI